LTGATIVVIKDDMQATPYFTSVQLRIAQAITESERKKEPPFVSHLVKALGYAGPTSLVPTLKIMERKGLLEIMGGGKQRAFRLLRLTAKAKYLLGIAGLPLLGSIPAGPLAEAFSDEMEIVEVDSILAHRPGDFLLRADGRSMIGDGILNGDLVLLRPNIDVQQGEIAAVYAGDSYNSTLKHVYFEPEQVRLKASNSEYQDILIPLAEWRGTAGVFRGLVRHVSH
jgi:repressor LexA